MVGAGGASLMIPPTPPAFFLPVMTGRQVPGKTYRGPVQSAVLKAGQIIPAPKSPKAEVEVCVLFVSLRLK